MPKNVPHPWQATAGVPIPAAAQPLAVPPLGQEQLASFFAGPLATLLELARQHRLDVKTHRLDIKNLRLAELTGPYLAQLAQMRQLDLDVASEFLALSADLIWIKARSLLPAQHREPWQEDDPDSEAEDRAAAELEAQIIARLEAYEVLQQCAEALEHWPRLGRDVFAPGSLHASVDVDAPVDAPVDIDVSATATIPAADAAAHSARASFAEQLDVVELLDVLSTLLEKQSRRAQHMQLSPPEVRVEQYLARLIRQLSDAEQVFFSSIMSTSTHRVEVLTYFMGLLELARLGGVRLFQTGYLAPLCAAPVDALRASPEAWLTRVLHAFQPARTAPADQGRT